MQITPKQEHELESPHPFPKGTYRYDVLAEKVGKYGTDRTEDRTSNNGNEMIQLVLLLTGRDGSKKVIKDYLMEAIDYKLRHAFDASKALNKYESGCFFAADLIGTSGLVEIDIEPETIAKNKDGSIVYNDDGTPKKYPAKNVVVDYVKRANVEAYREFAAAIAKPSASSSLVATAVKAAPTQAPVDLTLDDEIPF